MRNLVEVFKVAPSLIILTVIAVLTCSAMLTDCALFLSAIYSGELTNKTVTAIEVAGGISAFGLILFFIAYAVCDFEEKRMHIWRILDEE